MICLRTLCHFILLTIINVKGTQQKKLINKTNFYMDQSITCVKQEFGMVANAKTSSNAAKG